MSLNLYLKYNSTTVKAISLESIIVRISGKVYAKAFDEKWLPSLAMFVFISRHHTGKNYYFRTGDKTKMVKNLASRLNISLTSLQKHLNILKKAGLVTLSKNEMKLISNKKMLDMGGRIVFVPKNISDLSDIKYFLNTIPVLSNIVQQKKTISRIKRYQYIKGQAEKANGKLKIGEYTALKAYIRSGGKMECDSEITLSVKRMGELLEKKSKNTVSAYKKFLKEKGLIKVFNEIVRIFPGKIGFSHFLELKKGDLISSHSFFYKNYVYENRCSTLTVAYRPIV